jgi:hypothetical protein
MPKHLLALAALLPLVLFAALACGDDDDDDDGGTTSTATATETAGETATEPAATEPGGEAGQDSAAYVEAVDALEGGINDAFAEVETAGSAREGFEMLIAAIEDYEAGLQELTPPAGLEDLHEELAAGSGEARANLETLLEAVPDDAPIDELAALVFGGEDPFVRIMDANCELLDYAQENSISVENLDCEDGEGGEDAPGPEAAGDNPVTVEGADYSFELGSDPTAETTGFVFENVGEEPHELFFGTIPEDADVDALLQEAAQLEGPPPDYEVVGVTFAEPGGSAGLPFEQPLEPGRYLMVCFIPDAEGTPHAFLGMAEEFTVE